MNTNDIARIAALLGEPARTAMLLQLMDGRALTANELARAGNVSAQTASGHLSKLVQAGLLTVQQQGRHRYAGGECLLRTAENDGDFVLDVETEAPREQG